MLANVLTGLRLILALPVTLAFAYPGALAPESLVALILLAIASDLADGPAARRFGTASSAGMLFDHGTDFFFVTSALFAIAFSGKNLSLTPLPHRSCLQSVCTRFLFFVSTKKPAHELARPLEWRVLFRALDAVCRRRLDREVRCFIKRPKSRRDRSRLGAVRKYGCIHSG
jgi:phosphatidylglycerophosphate synthase